MKHVVSISLGSSTRNHAVETEFMGEKFRVERIGTDGDWDKARKMIREMDGKVDAFGMGGISLYVYAGDKKYILRDAKKLLLEAKKTPMVDGGGLKNTLEKHSIELVAREGIVNFKNKKTLMVCGVDRPGMAKALVEQGCICNFGDLIYSIGLPIRINNLSTLELIGKLLIPIIKNMPFDSLYPTGEKQEVILPKFSKYYYEAEIIAGDFLYIKRYLAPRLDGKVIVTNTTTPQDVELLKNRGAKLLITTTPEMEGRSFGTNVMEALMVAILNKPLDQITEADYTRLIKDLDFRPGVIYLNN
ncbi:MAG: hypothetical protein ACM3MK_03405 [Chitinophagales bacterium]